MKARATGVRQATSRGISKGSFDPSAAASEPVRLLLVEDNLPLRRSWLRALGSSTETMNYRGGRLYRFYAADSLAAARRQLARERPFAAAIVDLCLPDGRGEDLIVELSQRCPAMGLIAVTAAPLDDRALDLVGRCHAARRKPVELDELVELIGSVVDRLAGLVASFAAERGLSQRERQLLLEAARGAGSDDRISEILGCSATTARTYWRRIFDKLEVRSQRDVLAALLRFAAGHPLSL